MGIEAATAFLSTPAQLSPAIAPQVLSGVSNVLNYGFSIPPGQFVAPGIVTGAGVLAAGEVLGYGASAVAATLLTPEVLAVAGTLAIAAMVAATIGASRQAPNTSIPASDLNPVTGTGGTYGVAGQSVYIYGTIDGARASAGFPAVAPVTASPGQTINPGCSFLNFGNVDFIYTYTSANESGTNEIICQYKDDQVPGVVVTDAGTGEELNPFAPGVEQTQSPEKAYATPLAQQLPGYPTPKGVGDPVAGKAPQRSTVNAPDGTPLTRTSAPGTGATVDTKPGTGTTTAHDPGTGKTTTITPDPKTAESNKTSSTNTIIPTIPTSCPDPCPPVDFSAVLEAIANVKAELDLVTDRIGFQSASLVTQCGSSEAVSTVQQFFEAVDGKLGFEDALLPPDGVAGTDDICNVSEAAKALLEVVPSVTVVQGFEVRSVRDSQLSIYFNVVTNIIKTRFLISVPSPIADLTPAIIRQNCDNRIPGDWLVSLTFDNAMEIKAWFADPDEGEAYLIQLAALSTLPYTSASAFTKTNRPGKGPALAVGTVVYPVVALLFEGNGQAGYRARYVLKNL